MIDKFKKFFKENWKFFLFLVLFYGIMTFELPYVIYTPGGAIDMTKRIEGDNTYDSDGSFSMTYVSMVRGSAPFLALSYIIPNWDIVPSKNITYPNGNLNETIKIDKIYMKEAISSAEYVAYSRAGIDFTESNIHHFVTFMDENAKTKLKVGDEILKIDGNDFESLKKFQEYVTTKKVGDRVKIEYMRNDKKYEDETELIDIGGKAKVGIGIATVSDYDTPFNIEVKTKSSESGPSGGLITTLEIYDKITEEDITHGLKIMGTGTIDKEGNVGEIGGVKYKLIGAVKNKADVFICPVSNYEEALKVKKEKKYDIKIISAKTFDEALSKLKNI